MRMEEHQQPKPTKEQIKIALKKILTHQRKENKEKNKEYNGIKETKQDAKGNIESENN